VVVPTPGTAAGDQLPAVFQFPLAAAAQEVCARTAVGKLNASNASSENCSVRKRGWRRLDDKTGFIPTI
jgi:hypothetical protein